VYGVVGLKTHAKMLLVTRREGQAARYGHLSTGNYNPRTARLYTDISYLTADPALTADIDKVFLHLASQSRLPRLHQGVAGAVPPAAQADRENRRGRRRRPRAGKDARIVLKMNALTDEALMLALVRAGQQGVRST
jgi:polyphosphate kinase